MHDKSIWVCRAGLGEKKKKKETKGNEIDGVHVTLHIISPLGDYILEFIRIWLSRWKRTTTNEKKEKRKNGEHAFMERHGSVLIKIEIGKSCGWLIVEWRSTILAISVQRKKKKKKKKELPSIMSLSGLARLFIAYRYPILFPLLPINCFHCSMCGKMMNEYNFW